MVETQHSNTQIISGFHKRAVNKNMGEDQRRNNYCC